MNELADFLLNNEATVFVSLAIVLWPTGMGIFRFLELVFGWPEDVSPRVVKRGER